MLYISCFNAENGIRKPENVPSAAQSWVGTVAARRGSDLAASGAGNGLVRLWAIKPDSKGVEPLFDLKLVCYSCYSIHFAECSPEYYIHHRLSDQCIFILLSIVET